VTDDIKTNLGKPQPMPFNAKDNLVDQTMALIASLAQPLQPANKELWNFHFFDWE